MQEQFVQIIKNRFYFAISDCTPKNIKNGLCFNTDMDLEYKSFNKDFGPLNIGYIHQYTKRLESVFSNINLLNKVFIHQTSKDYRKNTNAALLVCSAMIILFEYDPENIWKKFEGIKFQHFRDVSQGECTYKCSILDCLKGLNYAIKLGWYNFKTFDVKKYKHYDSLENGYINQIIPGKLFACSAPHNDQFQLEEGFTVSVKKYAQIFKQLDIAGVIRLNQETYNRQFFLQNDIQHYSLPFKDGTNPPQDIIQQFFKITQNQKKYVVHCAAGLGRTGSVIACFAMKHYNYNATQFIGWIRLCRPGSIIGPQQHFLLEIQQSMKSQKNKSFIWKQLQIKVFMEDKQNDDNFEFSLIQNRKMSEDQQKIKINGDNGQGQKLIKLRHNQVHLINPQKA